MNIIEVKVPDIGDFADVPVIEILAKAGDKVNAEDGLITLESDKATMDIPAPVAGTIKEIKVKIGDKVRQGSLIASIAISEESGVRSEEEKPAPDSAPSPAPTPVSAPPRPAPDSTAPSTPHSSLLTPHSPTLTPHHDIACDVVVLGAGPGGYSAAFRAADLGLKVVLVERYATLGGVCLNVGCIPSKALLHVAAVMDEAAHFSELGVDFGAPKIDLDKLRAHKDKVVAKLTTGLAGMAKARKVEVLRGTGKFAGPNHLSVATDAGARVVKFAQAIIAAGSQAMKLPSIPEDPRVVDSTGALELATIPKQMLVIGGGIIGLEMATVYSTLGARISVVEMLDGLMTGVDRDLFRVWEKRNAPRFDKIMLNTKTTNIEAKADGIWVTFEGEQAPTEAQRYDLVLVAAGRSPNGNRLEAQMAGVKVTERGFIEVDKQMRTNVPHIFAIGDIVGQPMLAHKAVHEGHVAAEAAAGQKSHFDATVIPSVAYTDPEIAWVGITEGQAKAEGRAVDKGLFPWAASGRAIANGADYGFTKLLFDAETKRIVGGGIVGPSAGDIIGEIALAIEMGADAVDIGKTIHPHPTLGETVGLAAEVAHGSCTDLPPQRKR